MSRIIVEFRLPEERTEYEIAHNAQNYYDTLRELDESLRGYIKYGNHDFQDVNQALEYIREFINSSVNLYDIE